MIDYKNKYLKYKLKYSKLIGGMGFDVLPQYNLENFKNNLEKLKTNIRNIIEANMNIKIYLEYYKLLFMLIKNKNLNEIKKIIRYFDKLNIKLKKIYGMLSLFSIDKFNLGNLRLIGDLFNIALKVIQINSILWKILVLSDSLIMINNSLVNYKDNNKNNLIYVLTDVINKSNQKKLAYIDINKTIGQKMTAEKLKDRQIINAFRFAFFRIITQIANAGESFTQIKNLIDNMNNDQLNLPKGYYKFHIEFDEFANVLKKCQSFIKLNQMEQIKNRKNLLMCKKAKNSRNRNLEKSKLLKELDILLETCIF